MDGMIESGYVCVAILWHLGTGGGAVPGGKGYSVEISNLALIFRVGGNWHLKV